MWEAGGGGCRAPHRVFSELPPSSVAAGRGPLVYQFATVLKELSHTQWLCTAAAYYLSLP